MLTMSTNIKYKSKEIPTVGIMTTNHLRNAASPRNMVNIKYTLGMRQCHTQF